MVRHPQQPRRASRLAPRFRHRSESGQGLGKPLVAHRKRQSGSKHYGLHIRRTNHPQRKNALERRTEHRQRRRLLLERKQAIGPHIERHPPSLSGRRPKESRLPHPREFQRTRPPTKKAPKPRSASAHSPRWASFT